MSVIYKFRFFISTMFLALAILVSPKDARDSLREKTSNHLIGI